MEKVTKEVMGAVFFEQGRILVMRRAPFMSCPGSWEFPGGKLEAGETHEACLARELREELHIEARIGAFLADNRHEYEFGTVHLCVYRVLSWKGDIALTVHDDMRWELTSGRHRIRVAEHVDRDPVFTDLFRRLRRNAELCGGRHVQNF